MRVSRASLDGAGWGRWRGQWQSSLWLAGTANAWRLMEEGREVRRWGSLQAAVADLWRRRGVRGEAPWVVGWIGFAACAEVAGGMPARRDVDDVPTGVVLVEPVPGGPDAILEPGRPGFGSTLSSSLDDGEFAAAVERVRGEIEAGNVYQVNLCRRFTVAPWRGGLKGLFEATRGGAEPDYLCRVTWGGDRPGELVCGSMELLLRRRGQHVETRPIKGTRRRGGSSAEDLALIRALDGDPKERAELAMIVDLERNDLGRVAVPGSVVVSDPGAVHTWRGIHHRVARITAMLPEGTSSFDVIRAVVPGGSVTGCPKRAAMATIAELETAPRGPFTGALGVIAGNGDLELALPIRTAWTAPERLEMASGCGIVWQSEPLLEVAESRLKLARWLALFEESGR